MTKSFIPLYEITGCAALFAVSPRFNVERTFARYSFNISTLYSLMKNALSVTHISPWTKRTLPQSAPTRPIMMFEPLKLKSLYLPAIPLPPYTENLPSTCISFFVRFFPLVIVKTSSIRFHSHPSGNEYKTCSMLISPPTGLQFHPRGQIPAFPWCGSA